MNLNIFIDTNILLTFFHYASDDLEELKKLIVLLKQGEVTLYTPSQVVDEFRRNRETKLADALKRFREQKISGAIPQFCHDYPEYQAIRAAQKKYEEQCAALLD
jgi:predicted nucleic acid-binding protein